MIIYDASQLFGQQHEPQAGPLVLSNIEPGTMSILQLDTEDTIDTALPVLRQIQDSAVIIVLPSAGEAFDHPLHFIQLSQLLDNGQARAVAGFVIPESRMSTIARHAHAQGFRFASSLEKALQLSMPPASHRVRNTGKLKNNTGADLTPHRDEVQQPAPIPPGLETILPQTVTAPRMQPSQPDPVTPLPETAFTPAAQPRVQNKQHLRGKRVVLIASLISVLVLLSAAILTVLFVSQPATGAGPRPGVPAPALQVGTLAFADSGFLDPTSKQGLNDVLSLKLDHLMPPTAGRAYYAWLLPDTTNDETKPLLLGSLNVHTGAAQLSYTSPTHTDLLATFSRLRITEQEQTPTPVTPSLDPGTWRYSGAIPSTPTPGDENHYSFLSHLRHLLAKDPTLQQIGLDGGLEIWLYRNAGKVVEYTTATRDDWPTKGAADLMHRQIVRILDYLDGSAFVWQEVPAGTPFLVDPKAARMGLLERSPTQNPPGYLAHIDIHLQGLTNSPGHTNGQRQLALQIDQAIKQVTTAMSHIHADAVQLVKLNNNELQQQHALDLINDMVTNANQAYTGRPDPATGENTQGITFIHNKLQSLATIPVTPATEENV